MRLVAMKDKTIKADSRTIKNDKFIGAFRMYFQYLITQRKRGRFELVFLYLTFPKQILNSIRRLVGEHRILHRLSCGEKKPPSFPV